MKNQLGEIKKTAIDFTFFLAGMDREIPAPGDYRPSVTILIPAYNEEKFIADTINSIKRQTYSNIKRIVVADDASTDKTGIIAANLGATVVRTPKNTGTKSQAQNYAIFESPYIDTDLVTTIDADTTLAPDAIEKIVPAMYDQKTFSACGFVIPQVVETIWETARLGQYLYCIGLNKKAQNNVGMPLVSSGCFSIFNTVQLKELGGFPLETMVEDMALTWKAHILGYKIKLIPGAVCYPKDPATWNIYKKQVLRWYRGFLQCVSLYKMDVFKNKKLGLFVFWYTLSGLIAPITWIILIGILPLMLFTGKIMLSLLILTWFAVDVTLTFAVIMYEGLRMKKGWRAFAGFLLYWLVSPLESYLFMLSVWNEWILRNTLTTWDKGH